ncbi:hypothetical protein AB0M43_07585 [Longispora sp. NPDC051575]
MERDLVDVEVVGVDGQCRRGMIGAAICLLGVAVIMYAPRT